jgi:hypothetical protein
MDREPRVLLALAIALSAALIAVVCFRPTGTVDLWWTLQVGDHILAEGEVPRTALWTIDAVRDEPYVCHGWLPALAFSAVAQVFGLDAVPALPTAVALVVFLLMIAIARARGASWLLSVVVSDLLIYTVLFRMVCRAEIFAYLCFALTLHRIAVYLGTRRGRELAWLVPIALLWVNSHASFLLLFGLLPLLAAGVALDTWRDAGFRRGALAESVLSRATLEIAAALGVVALSSLANPYGLDLLRSVLEPAQAGSMTGFIVEWQPLYEVGWLPDRFLVPAALLAGALVLGVRRLSAVSILLAIVFTALAVSAARHLAFFGIAAVFVLGEFAAGLRPAHRTRTAIAAATAAGLAAAIVSASATLGFDRRSLTRYPSPWITTEALDFVRDHLEGNVLNSYHLGGVLTWFAWPQVRVAIDPRADPFPADYYRAYRRALYRGPGATLAFADRYSIDHILVARFVWDGAMRSWRDRLDGFRLVYEDGRVVILSRDDPAAGRASEPPPSSRQSE